MKTFSIDDDTVRESSDYKVATCIGEIVRRFLVKNAFTLQKVKLDILG